jgi:hypothetical protein
MRVNGAYARSNAGCVGRREFSRFRVARVLGTPLRPRQLTGWIRWRRGGAWPDLGNTEA